MLLKYTQSLQKKFNEAYGTNAIYEKTSVPSVPSVPKPAPSPTSAPAPKADLTTDDMTALWPKAVQLASNRRPLIRTWLSAARFLGTEGRHVLLGFSPEEKTFMESLARPASRSFLEALLKEMSGSDWTLKMSVVEGLPLAERTTPATEATRPNDSLESFKDDPLIREALELFKGEIKSVTT